jgi:hypothetical protein
MTLVEIEREVMSFSESERAFLAARLLATLPLEGQDISDFEVERREEELDSGEIETISHEELVRSVEQNRSPEKERGLSGPRVGQECPPSHPGPMRSSE